MESKTERTMTVPCIFIIVFSALLAQLIGRYHADALVIGNNFYLSWLFLRIAFPVAVLLALRVPLSRVGVGMPVIDGSTVKLIILIFVLVSAAFIFIYFFESYFRTYSGSFQGGNRFDRFAGFMLFTGSTLTGWEFLHRGFLLFGIFYILTERDRLPAATASAIAVTIVWAFEVLFHFIKPELEAIGLLVGSPVLSWLALRTRSIWVPFLIHLLVELLFILSLVMR